MSKVTEIEIIITFLFWFYIIIMDHHLKPIVYKHLSVNVQ